MAKAPKAKKAERVPRNAPESRLALAAWKMVLAEINGGRSSMVLAVGGVAHLNDMLHTAGLISNDAWNMTKGWVQTFATASNFSSFASAAGSVLKTVVEAAEPSLGRRSEAGERAADRQEEAIAQLAAIEAANADTALEG